MAPLGCQLLGNFNPVRIGGPMQVSIDLATPGETIHIPSNNQSAAKSLPAARHVLRYRPLAQLADRLPHIAVPLRGVQRRLVRQPQRRAPERRQLRLGHPLGADGDLIR